MVVVAHQEGKAALVEVSWEANANHLLREILRRDLAALRVCLLKFETVKHLGLHLCHHVCKALHHLNLGLCP